MSDKEKLAAFLNDLIAVCAKHGATIEADDYGDVSDYGTFGNLADVPDGYRHLMVHAHGGKASIAQEREAAKSWVTVGSFSGGE